MDSYELERMMLEHLNQSQFNTPQPSNGPIMFADESKLIVESVTMAELMILCGGWLWQLMHKSENERSVDNNQ